MVIHEEMFDTVKKMNCQDSILDDINKPFKGFCDASPKGLGACLVHVMPNGDERLVVVCFSRSLS